MGDRDRRVKEYVDSPRMERRRIEGDVVSARIAGSYGTYEVRWDQDIQEGTCTCPHFRREEDCKHVDALILTFDLRPESFREGADGEDSDEPEDTWFGSIAERARRHWELGLSEDIALAVQHIAGAYGLNQDEIEAVEEELHHGEESFRQWPLHKPPITVAQAVERAGLAAPPAPPPPPPPPGKKPRRRSGDDSCPGCGARFDDPDPHLANDTRFAVVTVASGPVHANTFCLARLFGPESDELRRIEDAMEAAGPAKAVPRPPR